MCPYLFDRNLAAGCIEIKGRASLPLDHTRTIVSNQCLEIFLLLHEKVANCPLPSKLFSQPILDMYAATVRRSRSSDLDVFSSRSSTPAATN